MCIRIPHFLEKETDVVNTEEEILNFRDMQIKTIMKYLFTPIHLIKMGRMAIPTWREYMNPKVGV